MMRPMGRSESSRISSCPGRRPRRSKPWCIFPGLPPFAIDPAPMDRILEDFDFIIKSGRAVMFPVYKSTFERGDDLKNGYPNTTSFYRDHVIAWSKDLGRSIDYLETRPDIDHNKLAYEGRQLGSSHGGSPSSSGRSPQSFGTHLPRVLFAKQATGSGSAQLRTAGEEPLS